MSATVPDHILHFTPGKSGGWGWRLGCLPGDGHFTADLQDWEGQTADELEAEGVTVDRSTCWVHDWIANSYGSEEWMKVGAWTEDGPWPVTCSFNGGLLVTFAP
jgi:hypothetical protein